MLLAGLDEVDWAKLSHAYGKAGDVPGLLRDLTNTGAKTRAGAIAKLAASLCHQGTLTRATAEAVPFFVELLAAPKVKDKEAILALLADIATLGDVEPLLLTGTAPGMGGLPAPFKKAVAAVRDASDVYVALLASTEAAVRGAAAYLLAWLPGAAAAALPALTAALVREKDEGAKAALALSLAYAARYEGADEPAALRLLLAAKAPALRAVGALGLAHVHAGKVAADVVEELGLAAANPGLEVDHAPWLDGDLSSFAARILTALPRTDRTDELLLLALEKNETAFTFVANVVVRRFFRPVPGRAEPARRPHGVGTRLDVEEDRLLAELPVQLSSLDPRQRRFMEGIAKQPERIAGDLAGALAERGLPSTPSLVARWLGGSSAAKASLLDRTAEHGGKAQTLAELYVAAVKAGGTVREGILAAIRSAITPEEQVELALRCLVEVDVSWGATISFELVWAAAPKAEAHVRREADRLAKEGVPKRVTANGPTQFPSVLVAVGVGLASIALARHEPAPPETDAMLQHAHGYWPRVRDALAALPIERRESWVLDGKRDDRAQPTEDFKGAWPYFVVVPTAKVADRALAHVAQWKPKDPWGAPRKKHADPLLAELVAALRSAGNEADASRCAEALARLR